VQDDRISIELRLPGVKVPTGNTRSPMPSSRASATASKTLKRRAYGYRNDRGFLLRCLSLIHTD